MKTIHLFILTFILTLPLNNIMAGEASNAAADMTEAADMSAVLQDGDDKYGEDSVQCVRNWSLYAEYYRQRNYDMAYDPWREMLDICPKSTINIYIHGANMLKHFYQEATEPEEQEAWADSLMMLYDQRIEHFGNKGRNLGRKAADLYQLRPNNVQELYDITEESIELQGMNAGADVLLINFQSTMRLAQSGVKDTDVLVEKFERATDIIDYNLEHNPEDERYYQSAKDNILSMFEPFASCENLVNMFQPRFEESPEDQELLEQIIDMMETADCEEEELYYEVTTELHKLDPDAESAFLLGDIERDREDHDQAMDYYQEAVDRYEADNAERHSDQIFRAYWYMSEITYRELGNYSEARRLALEAHEADPDDGRPFILIGEMYAASSEQCGEDEFTETTPYLAAVDKFEQASDVAEESAIRDRAAELADTYRQYFPDRELIFFHGYDVGDTITVECWINETTTIRAR